MTAYGGIEAGGSKWECAVGTGPDDLRATETVPTTTPEETLGRVVAFFEREGPVEAIGVGSFGPVDRKPTSPTWGHITTTPKPGWAHTDVGQEIRRRLSVPVAFDTDVNAAAVGEQRWGAAQGLDTFCYITVGTGIGGGAMVGGTLVHGLVHPEFGHMRIPHDRDADPFPGVCPYHGDCWEGLASGRAVEARWGRPASELDDDAVWQLQARVPRARSRLRDLRPLAGANRDRRRPDEAAGAPAARPTRGRGAHERIPRQHRHERRDRRLHHVAGARLEGGHAGAIALAESA